jgi:type II secretory pathway pseudopilin PulG
MRRLAVVSTALVLGAAVLTGCSEGEADRAADRAEQAANEAADRVREEAEKLPDVDWGKQGRQLKRRLDRLAENADCSQLRKLAQRESNDTEVTRYIKAQLRRVC